MGTNKKKSTQDTDINKTSGNDPRGRGQNLNLEERQRYRDRSDPFTNELGRNWGRATETSARDYGDIMGQYRNIAGGGGPKGERISYSDPFKSYGGYEEFSKSGGYSPQDLANLRARGTSPIRAVYSDANRAVERQKSLQGGYSPNYTASKAKMAREQAFSTADAVQNVEAGLSEAIQKGKLAGLGGMSNIEGQRLGADLDVGKFNAMQGNQDRMNEMNALQGMTSLYGTTPGMANMFGNQLGQAINQSGNMGQNYVQNEINAQNLPGRYDQTKGYINDMAGAVSPWIDDIAGLFKKKTPTAPVVQGKIPSGSGTKRAPGSIGTFKF